MLSSDRSHTFVDSNLLRGFAREKTSFLHEVHDLTQHTLKESSLQQVSTSLLTFIITIVSESIVCVVLRKFHFDSASLSPCRAAALWSGPAAGRCIANATANRAGCVGWGAWAYSRISPNPQSRSAHRRPRSAW